MRTYNIFEELTHGYFFLSNNRLHIKVIHYQLYINILHKNLFHQASYSSTSYNTSTFLVEDNAYYVNE